MNEPRNTTVDAVKEPDPAAVRKAQAGIILLLLALILMLRLPFHAQYLTKWDSCNYAFALENFNIADHSPHPPGYPLYIFTAKVINTFVNDANKSYIIEGIILCWIAAAFLYLTGRMLFGFTIGFFASLLFIVSPPAWYLSSAAMSYMSEPAMMMAVLYLAILTHKRPDLKWPPVVMALAMGVGGAFRIYGVILCLPIYLIHLLDISWVKRIASVLIILIILVLAYGWVIQKTGGWEEYSSEVKKESVKHEGALGRLVENPGSELKRNISQIILFNYQSFGFLWFVLFLPLLFPRMLFTRLTREKLFLWAALLCPLLVYTIIYVNLTSIMLILLPMYCLILIQTFAGIALFISGLVVKEGNAENRGRPAKGIFFLVIVLVVLFVGSRYFAGGGVAREPQNEFCLSRIINNDAYFSSLIDAVEKYPPDQTCLLLYMEAKHAGYYLRDYHVIWDKYVIRKPTSSDIGKFSLKGGKRIMLPIDWVETETGVIFSLPLPEGCRTLIFRGDIKRTYMMFDEAFVPFQINNEIDLWVVTNIPEGWAIIVNRELGPREDERIPPVTWTIGPRVF